MIALSELFTFYSNRSLLQWPKSAETILSDINNELLLSYKDIISIHTKLLEIQNKIREKISTTNTTLLIDHINSYNTSNKIEAYTVLSNLNKYKVLKNLYRISIPDFIYLFIELHKSLLQNESSNIVETINDLIIPNNYSTTNTLLSNYIKKLLIIKLLINSSNNKSLIIDYYNYSRFLYLYTILSSLNLVPLLYNPNTGSIYFTIPYSKTVKKEQIFESINVINKKNLVPISIDKVVLYINTPIGEIMKVKNKNTNTIIIDNIEFKTPNIVRKVIHELLNNFSNTSTYNYSYSKLLGTVLKSNTIVEDYCEKIDTTGTILRVPYKTTKEWEDLNSKEVRKMNINNHINIELLLSSYKKIIDPILRIVSSIKL